MFFYNFLLISHIEKVCFLPNPTKINHEFGSSCFGFRIYNVEIQSGLHCAP